MEQTYPNPVIADAVNTRREVEAAARYLAIRGLTGATGDPLPPLMSGRAVQWIERFPEAFRARVAEYRGTSN